jgi:hypothetical protein
MAIDSFETLVQAVVSSSTSGNWAAAVGEWEVTRLEEDPTESGICVCGQTGLVKLFTITNRLNGSELHPIGSVCVNKFEQEELDRQVDLFGDLHALRKSIQDGSEITLTSEYFSRAMLEHLYFRDVFTPDSWNGGNGVNDYEFLLKMFNKRNKENITSRQQSKIYMLLLHKVVPFVLADDRLR